MNAQLQSEFSLPEKKENLKVFVGIRFGNPKHEDCRNFGICKMEMIQNSNTLFEKKEHCSRAIIVKEVSYMEIYFEKKSMTKNTIRKQFSSMLFLIEREKYISGTIASNLNEKEFSLQAGEYKVIEIDNFLIVKIPFE